MLSLPSFSLNPSDPLLAFTTGAKACLDKSLDRLGKQAFGPERFSEGLNDGALDSTFKNILGNLILLKEGKMFEFLFNTSYLT